MNDTDLDGVCDELEIEGCTDLSACNYDPLATDEGDCEYLEEYEITGSLFAETFGIETYTYVSAIGSTYEWTCVGGVIQSGNGSAEIELVWAEEGIGELCVTETSADGCLGMPVCIDVAITGTTVVEAEESVITLYPNPASQHCTITLSEGSAYTRYMVYDSYGRRVTEGVFYASVNVLDISSLRNGVYHVQLLLSDGRVARKGLVVQR